MLCASCSGPIGDSVSEDFCSELCQVTWRHRQVGAQPPHLFTQPFAAPMAFWGGYRGYEEEDE